MSINFVQGAQGAGSGTSFTLAFPSPVTIHNFIGIGVEWNAASATASITDTLLDSYAGAVSSVNAFSGQNGEIFFAANINGGANSVTVHFNNTVSYCSMEITEWSGVKLATPFSGLIASATGLSAAPASGTFTTTAGNLVLGLGSNTLAGIAAGSGFTSRGSDTFSMLESQIAAGASANATFTCPSSRWLAMGCSFLPAPAGAFVPQVGAFLAGF